MTSFKTPQFPAFPIPQNQEKSGFNPLENFKKGFEVQISPKIKKTLEEQLSKIYNVKFVEKEKNAKTIFTFNWFICELAQLSTVSHQVVINELNNAKETVRNALLNLGSPLSEHMLYNTEIVCGEVSFDQKIFVGQIILWEMEAELTPKIKRKKEHELAPVV